MTFLTIEDDSFTLTEICTHLGVVPSTVYNMVIRYLLSEDEKSQFTGVLRNKDLILNKIAKRTGLEPEELHEPLSISAIRHSESDIKSNDLDARMENLAKKTRKMRTDILVNEISNPKTLISRYTTLSHEKREYPLTQQPLINDS